jgi:sigma-B regulation protein RsbU (phosphoserine phosphatase)
MPTITPLAHEYRQALDQLRREGGEASVLKRMSELVALLDLAAALGSGPGGAEALHAPLLAVMGEMRARRGAFYVRGEDGAFTVQAAIGMAPDAPLVLDMDLASDEPVVLGAEHGARRGHGFALLCPVRREGRTIAVLGLGPPATGEPYGPEEVGFARSAAACAAAAIDRDLLHEELRRVNQRLTVKVFELRNLFDMSRDLTGGSEEELIQDLIATTVMGHFLVSRCGLYLLGPGGLALASQRGLRRGLEGPPLPPEEARAALEQVAGPTAVGELAEGELRRRLEEARLALVVPLDAGGVVQGLLAIGERASRTPFSAEDREFAQTMARQAAAALESARLHRIRMEKQRQDGELQLAREIQRSLLPPRSPEVPGFDVAAESRSCYEVGGDTYDWIDLDDGRLALVIADVSGKGTPASLLMASVQASVHAIAGMAGPAEVMERLNHFLFARSQANRYVTLFYAELDPATGRLAYVNAGHLPPYCISPDGTWRRLPLGGLALGLMDGTTYDVGELTLGPGDDTVGEVLRGLSGGTAAEILAGLVAAVNDWVGGAASSDDLTALVLKVG